MSSKVFYPYHYAEQALEITDLKVDIDGQPDVVNEFIDQEHRSVVLTSLEQDWSTLLIRVSVSDPNDQLQSTLPPEPPDEVIQLWIVARNKTTRLRKALPLVKKNGLWVGELPLTKSELARTTELDCFAILSADLEPADAYAWNAHERIADAPGWKLYTDIVPSMPGGALNSQWVNFEESDNPELSQRKDCVWYLDLSDEESPRLLLNEGVPQLRQTLEVEQKTSKSARVRDALIHSILQSAINELAVFSLCKANGAPLDELPDWQQKLLTSLARRDSGASEDIVANRWITSWQYGIEASHVLTEICTAVQRHLNLTHSSEYLAKSVVKDITND